MKKNEEIVVKVKKDFTRYDLIKVLGETEGRCLFTTLRRRNLGVEKMGRCRYGNRYKKGMSGAIMRTIVFDIDECISRMESILGLYLQEDGRKVNKRIAGFYRETIKDLKTIKKYFETEEEAKAS